MLKHCKMSTCSLRRCTGPSFCFANGPVCRPSLSVVRVCSQQQDEGTSTATHSKQHGALAGETRLGSSAVPLFALAAADGLSRALQPQADYFNSLNLPDFLVKYGHPFNMLVVLLALGAYGSVYLGWQIRLAGDEATLVKAKDLHPKLAGAMFVFFALGAVGGLLSEVMQGRPLLESPHFTTGLIGLLLLSFQAMLPLFFADDPGTKTTHAFLGTGIIALFFVHAGLGLQLATSL